MPNVIIFGETGAGKSSVINMLEGDKQASVSDKATGVTFSNIRYEKTIRGSIYSVFDTVGLNEGALGTVSPRTAIEQLYKLMLQLSDGVHLLVYVMRAPRITSVAEQNYTMFFDIFCDQKVPIVALITGLEDRDDDMDGWWTENEKVFEGHNMSFKGHACITATRGKLKGETYSYAAEYETSKDRVESLILDSCAEEPWVMPTRTWFASTVIRMRNIFATFLGIEPTVLANELYRALRSYGELSDREARKKAKEIEKSSIKRGLSRLPFAGWKRKMIR